MKELLTSLGAPEDASEKFGTYTRLLREWNEKFNLTAITCEREIERKHYADSLTAVPLLPRGASVLDIGSGAGFPGIPLKIVRPDISVTLLDSVLKKVTFVREVIAALSLQGAEAVHARVEDYGRKDGFDVVVSRAVARLSTLAEYALPFVRGGGIFIAYKSERTDEEIAESESALRILGGKVREVADVSTAEVRKLVVIEKVAPSPEKYPRGRNLPRTKPL